MLTTIKHSAMATEFEVILAAQDGHLVEPAFEALELLDDIEAELTVYRKDSEISRINALGFDGPVIVKPSTFRLIEKSTQWSRRTGGAFDVTAGPLVKAWGFTERRGRKPTPDQVLKAKECVGFEHVRLVQEANSVQLMRPGMELNLGAIGKGDALDRLAQALAEKGLNNFLIHGGNSSVLARGDQIDGSGDGWAVGLAHPTKSGSRLAGMRLRNQAISTSGSGKQFFHHRGRRYGHVIDPRSGYPAGELLSLTAMAPLAVDAEACSTAYFVRGIEEIRADYEQFPDLPLMVGVQQADRQEAVRIISFGEIDWIDPPKPSFS